jgi:hypothetical protein
MTNTYYFSHVSAPIIDRWTILYRWVELNLDFFYLFLKQCSKQKKKASSDLRPLGSGNPAYVKKLNLATLLTFGRSPRSSL